MSCYRKFIDGYANYSSLLSPSTSKKEVQWTSEMEKAFHCLKSKLSNVTVLCVPSSADTLTLHTDASGLGVGTVLSVLREGKEVPTAFFSRRGEKLLDNGMGSIGNCSSFQPLPATAVWKEVYCGH